MPSHQPGYSCQKGRIMPTKKNTCNLKQSQTTRQKGETMKPQDRIKNLEYESDSDSLGNVLYAHLEN